MIVRETSDCWLKTPETVDIMMTKSNTGVVDGSLAERT